MRSLMANEKITIQNEPCNCPVGQCAQLVERDWLCVNRLTGKVVTMYCLTCGAATWHQDRECRRCNPPKRPASEFIETDDPDALEFFRRPKGESK